MSRLGTEAAAQLKLDQFNKETTVAENKEAIRLLREADIFVEAQFIVGLDNETAETLEETFRMAWDWQPDLANWAMYTPWPFTPLFQEIRDKVEVFDFSKYNFVTPIMKPAAMTRGELLDGVMKNYRRFYMRKALFHYPWRGTGFRRRYLLGCLKAFLKAGVSRTFYDLGKAGYWGPQTKEIGAFRLRRDPHHRRGADGRLGGFGRPRRQGRRTPCGGQGADEGPRAKSATASGCRTRPGSRPVVAATSRWKMRDEVISDGRRGPDRPQRADPASAAAGEGGRRRTCVGRCCSRPGS